MKLLVFLVWSASMAILSTAFVSPSNSRRSIHKPLIKAEFDRNKQGGHVNKPPVLDGTYAGDYGFDPLGFVRTKDDLVWYREAEIKHARLVSKCGRQSRCLPQLVCFHYCLT
jgi:hypothetical protein